MDITERIKRKGLWERSNQPGIKKTRDENREITTTKKSLFKDPNNACSINHKQLLHMHLLKSP